MRILTLFTLVLALPVLAACGSDGGKNNVKDAGGGDDDVAGDGDGDGDGDADGDGQPRECESAPGIDPWGGPQVWTFEELEDCESAAKCGGDDVMTYDQLATCGDMKCAPPAMEYTIPGDTAPAGGGTQWVSCLIDSFLSCASAIGGSCRYQWSEYACCADEKCPSGPDTCVSTMCMTEDDAFIECVGNALGAEEPDPCWRAVGLACLEPSMDAGAPDEDAGTPDAGAADAGTDGGTSMRILPAPSVNAKNRQRLLKAAFKAARQRGLI